MSVEQHMKTKPSVHDRRTISVRERYVTASVLLWLLLVTIVGRNAVTVLTQGRHVRTLGEAASSSPLGRGATFVALLALAVTVAYVVLRFFREPRGSAGLLLLAEAPFVLLLLRDFMTVGSVANPTIASIGLVLALWMIAPPFQVLRVLGVMSVVVAGISVILGVFFPTVALLGEASSNDKALLGSELLAGPFTHPNLLGLFLALSAPFVLMLRRWYLGLPLVLLALTWSASRTAILAAAVAFGIGLLLLIMSRSGRRRLGGLAVLVVLGIAVYVPLTTTNPTAFTRRGEIWIYSLAHLDGQWAWGLSPSWYDKVVPTSVGIFNAAAFHGHNDVITMLVRVGFVGLLLVVGTYFLAWRKSIRQSQVPTLPIVIFFIAAVTAGISETVWRPESDNILFVVSVIPVCIALFGVDVSLPNRSAKPDAHISKNGQRARPYR